MYPRTKRFFSSVGLLSIGSHLFRPIKRYEPVHHNFDDDEDQRTSKSELLGYPDSRLPARRAKNSHGGYIMYSGWALSIILVVAMTMLVWLDESRLKKGCFLETSSYSPLLDQVPNAIIETRRNGSIRWPSPYRGDPSPQVDQAWDKISMFRPLDLSVTEEQYRKIGNDPETAATNGAEYGGGYFLQVEFSHQLHCVNLLRKASHFKYEYYLKHDPDFKDKEETFKVHLDHCVEMLRQFVMCHADVGLVTAHWIEQRARPWPDFNTKQTCRNFEGIWQWTVDHQLPEGAPMMPLKPPGAKALSSPP